MKQNEKVSKKRKFKDLPWTATDCANAVATKKLKLEVPSEMPSQVASASKGINFIERNKMMLKERS